MSKVNEYIPVTKSFQQQRYLQITELQDKKFPGLSSNWKLKFKDFQAPTLFSSAFKALNIEEKNFKNFQGCVGTLNAALNRSDNHPSNHY